MSVSDWVIILLFAITWPWWLPGLIVVAVLSGIAIATPFVFLWEAIRGK